MGADRVAQRRDDSSGQGVTHAGRDAEKMPAADILARLRSLAPGLGALPVGQRAADSPLPRHRARGQGGNHRANNPSTPAAIRDAIARRDATRDPNGVDEHDRP